MISLKNNESPFVVRLVTLMNEQGWTYRSFADKVGISWSAVLGYTRRGQSPSVDIFAAMAEVLGVSMKYLYGIDDSRDGRSKE